MPTGITNILCVDGSTDPVKRRAWCASVANKSVGPLRPTPKGGWTLSRLIGRASDLAGKEGCTLVCLDVVLGLPREYLKWVDLQRCPREEKAAGFLDWLTRVDFADLDRTETDKAAWTPASPFFAVGKGDGERKTWEAKIGQKFLLRDVDRLTKASPVFLTGLAGQVGPASRSIWRELKPLLATPIPEFAVWPFEGDLARCAESSRVILAEIYPKASYGIALGARFPECLLNLKKGKSSVRARALLQVKETEWFQGHRVALEAEALAQDSGDEFDAALAALALLRLSLEGCPLDGSEYDDRSGEGGILGLQYVKLGGGKVTF